MSVITFWNNKGEVTGKTLSIAAIATHMAIEHNNRILIVKNDNIPIFSLNHYHNFIELCIHLYKDCTFLSCIF